ncbi:MAG: CoA-binding protein [Candidatus Methanomethylicia archaeon]
MNIFNTIFNPKTIAVIGASDNPRKLGYYCLSSLVNGGFRGEIYPVNPNLKMVMGLKSYPSITSIPVNIDLAVVVVPSSIVPQVLIDCVSKNVKGAVVITAGFREAEVEDGIRLQEAIKSIADKAGVKIIGPNTFGMVNLDIDLNASFTPELSKLKKGNVSLIGQSGGVCHLVAYMSTIYGLGFSKIVGLGNRCNVDFADIIEYLKDDVNTRVIAIHVEGVDDARRLIEAAKHASCIKPIVAYKTGRSRIADKASKTHTGSLAGNYQLYEAAFKQAGVLTVRDVEDFFDAMKALSICPIPKGNSIAIITGQAGLGIIAADACHEYGLNLAKLSNKTYSIIERLLPPLSIRENPIDMGPSWSNIEICKSIVEAVISDDSVHALVLCFTYASASPNIVLELIPILKEWTYVKPVTACLPAPYGFWLKDREILESCGVATYPTPSRAVKAISFLVIYGKLTERFTSSTD